MTKPVASPLVSVIIPAFNASRFIRDAIHSALSQSYSNVEVIVVDDGSTDDTVAQVRACDGVVCCPLPQNLGACAARNRGIELAKGSFLQFLDADDMLHKDKLAIQIPKLVEEQFDSVFSDVDVESLDAVDHCTEHKVWQFSREADAVVAALGSNSGTPSGLHVKSKVVEIGGFREDLPCAQDRDFHLRLACAGARFGLTPQPLATMRRHWDSVSGDFGKVLKQYANVLEPAYRSLRERDALTGQRARAFAGFMACAARASVRQGDLALARNYFQLARQMHPAGGIDHAYQNWSRLFAGWIGPVAAERLSLLVKSACRTFTGARAPHKNRATTSVP